MVVTGTSGVTRGGCVSGIRRGEHTSILVPGGVEGWEVKGGGFTVGEETGFSVGSDVLLGSFLGSLLRMVAFLSEILPEGSDMTLALSNNPFLNDLAVSWLILQDTFPVSNLFKYPTLSSIPLLEAGPSSILDRFLGFSGEEHPLCTISGIIPACSSDTNSGMISACSFSFHEDLVSINILARLLLFVFV